jgi:hypothetical protein
VNFCAGSIHLKRRKNNAVFHFSKLVECCTGCWLTDALRPVAQTDWLEADALTTFTIFQQLPTGAHLAQKKTLYNFL